MPKRGIREYKNGKSNALGNAGKVLCIDLSNRRVSKEFLDEATSRKYFGSAEELAKPVKDGDELYINLFVIVGG